MRLTATALTQPLSARIQVKTYSFSSILWHNTNFASANCQLFV
jgi:hypothetical protein